MQVENLKEVANSILKKKVQRICQKQATNQPFAEPVAYGPVNDVKSHIHGNMTIVVVDNGQKQTIGWSKFNPNDIRVVGGYSRNGKYWEKKESKYSEHIGIMKALDRAIDQLL